MSGSLNQLSQQLAATRQMLQQIEGRGALATPQVQPPQASEGKARQGHSSDDDTAVPR